MSLKRVSGWAFRPPTSEAATVQILSLDNRVIGQVRAEALREDVAEVWPGSARCGFVIALTPPILPNQRMRLRVGSESGSEEIDFAIELKGCTAEEVAEAVHQVALQPQEYPYAGAQLASLAEAVTGRPLEWRCALADEVLRRNDWLLSPDLVKFLRIALAPDEDARLLEKLIAVELADRRLRDPLKRDSSSLRGLLLSSQIKDLPDGWAVSEVIMAAARYQDVQLFESSLPLTTQLESTWRWDAALRLTHLLVEAAGTMPWRLAGGELDEVPPSDLSRMLSGTAPILRRRLGAAMEALAHELAYLFNPASELAAFNVAVNRQSRGVRVGIRSPMRTVTRIYAPDTGLLTLPRIDEAASLLKLAEGTSRDRDPSDRTSGPKISIIMPVRNGMPHIRRAVASLLTQDYGNLEVIVIDGGSNDGTAEFLAALEAYFDYFVSEPDNGQSHAINKGLSQATGDYIGWLNADDELLPGALREMSRVMQRSSADLVAGITVVERDGLIEMVTRTQMKAGKLSKEGLLDLFGNWFKGHYFYQPEVLIKRTTFVEAGLGVAEDLYFTMDYDLWLRLAEQGSEVAICDWPIALFRQHPDQKTADLTSTTNEQFTVWERFEPAPPPVTPIAQLGELLDIAPVAERPRVLFHSTRLAKVFSPRVRADLPEFMALHGIDLVFPDLDGDVEDLRSVDLVILPIHVRSEDELIRTWRRGGLEAPVLGWLWDNHHSHIAHAGILPELDVVVPGHSVPVGPLRALSALWTETLPLCVSQWTLKEIDAMWQDRAAARGRSDTVWGGFVDYPTLGRRSRAIKEVMSLPGFEDVRLIDEGELLDSYFAWPADKRFEEWLSHKSSLVWPLWNDLSQRFFDALTTGEVPIIVGNPPDLDALIAQDPEVGRCLVRVDSGGTDALERARVKALAIFEESGPSGIEQRHQVARRHTLEHRLLTLTKSVFNEAAVGSRGNSCPP